MRDIRSDIKSITTYGARKYIATDTQFFCATPKAYELWETAGFPDPGRRIKRWSASRIWAVNNEVI